MFEGLKIVTDEELRQTNYVWFHFQYREGDLIEAEGITLTGELHILDDQA